MQHPHTFSTFLTIHTSQVYENILARALQAPCVTTHKSACSFSFDILPKSFDSTRNKQVGRSVSNQHHGSIAYHF